MWLTTAMEVLFGGAILALAADFGAKRYGERRGILAGAVSAVAIATSLFMILLDWPASGGGLSIIQPVYSEASTMYMVDRFSVFAAFAVLTVGLIVTFYSWNYLGPEDNKGPFYALLLLLMGSLIGIVSAGDLLTLFLFWEGMSVSAYALVSFTRSQLSLEASMKYFFMAGIGSLLALFGMAVLYSVSGSLALGAIAFSVPGSQTATFGLAMLVTGLGVEAALVPLHTWLPDVYATASIPVASVVSGAVTGAGVFAILKVVQPLVPNGDFSGAIHVAQSNVPALQAMLVIMALVTMFVGNLSGLYQKNLRRMLSFSSIAQTGYMLAALATLSVPGLIAVVFSIWNHGILKSNLFMLVGKEGSNYENADFEKLAGAGRKDRALGFLYGSSALAMMGAPPFGMFWSEILIVLALVSASSVMFFWVAVAVVGNILLSIGYYYRIINVIVFGKSDGTSTVRPWVDLVPPMILLALSLLTGLFPFLILNHLI